MSTLKGWRTLLFAAIVALIGVIETFDWATVVPEGWEGVVITVVGIVTAYLRKITTTPVGQSN